MIRCKMQGLSLLNVLKSTYMLCFLVLSACENKPVHFSKLPPKETTDFQRPILFDSTLIDNWELNRITYYRYIKYGNNRKRPGGRSLQSFLSYDNKEKLVISFDKDYNLYALDSLIGSYEIRPGEMNNIVYLKGSWQSSYHPLFLNTGYTYWIRGFRMRMFVDVYVAEELHHRIEYAFSHAPYGKYKHLQVRHKR